jgi:undecaprenyl diphosphate synthase
VSIANTSVKVSTQPGIPSRCEAAGLDPARVPVHVAIIMDGNGRWARAHGLHRLEGHDRGYQTLKEIVFTADELGVRFLTVYGFSSENWRRPEEEVDGLMGLMARAMQAEIEELIERRVRVRVSGRMNDLPSDLQAVFTDAMNRTNAFTGLTFNLAINYGGRAEVVDAVQALAVQVQAGVLLPQEIDEAAIAANLYSPEIPDPDLLIRTAGEMRLSNFLLWETAYSEIYVTQTCWPDFDQAHLIAALQDYQKRVRRFGAVVE